MGEEGDGLPNSLPITGGRGPAKAPYLTSTWDLAERRPLGLAPPHRGVVGMSNKRHALVPSSRRTVPALAIGLP